MRPDDVRAGNEGRQRPAPVEGAPEEAHGGDRHRGDLDEGPTARR